MYLERYFPFYDNSYDDCANKAQFRKEKKIEGEKEAVEFFSDCSSCLLELMLQLLHTKGKK